MTFDNEGRTNDKSRRLMKALHEWPPRYDEWRGNGGVWWQNWFELRRRVEPERALFLESEYQKRRSHFPSRTQEAFEVCADGLKPLSCLKLTVEEIARQAGPREEVKLPVDDMWGECFEI